MINAEVFLKDLPSYGTDLCSHVDFPKGNEHIMRFGLFRFPRLIHFSISLKLDIFLMVT
jgi:hypothetical protein